MEKLDGQLIRTVNAVKKNKEPIPVEFFGKDDMILAVSFVVETEYSLIESN